MRDPYQVLGLAKSASAAEIKSTYRRLAKKYHPDQSKEPKAKDKFAEINSAYEILGEEAKRGAFDRGEIDAEGKPRAPSFEGFEGFGARRGGAGGESTHFSYELGGEPGGRGGIDPDILSELFGGRAARAARARAPAKGDDIAVAAMVPLAMAASGGSARVALPNGKTLDVAIPAGVEEGQQIRLRGQGMPGGGKAPAGDALVTIRYAPHPLFKVEGRDLRLELPITLYEAVLGAKVRAPTLAGEVEIAIPAGASSGRTLRLRGKGLPPTASNGQGDLMATLRIVLPGAVDSELAEMMRRWKEEHPYEPRAALG
jgi:DnaJ-class molecular chaperone